MTLENKAEDMLDKLNSVMTEYAPVVKDSAVEMMRINAVGELVVAFLVIATFMCVMMGLYSKRKFIKDRFKSYDDNSIVVVVVVIVITLTGLAYSISAIAMMLNHWNWIALFDPELALAHKILF